MEAYDRAFPEAALKSDSAGDLRRSQATDLHVSAHANADVTTLLPQPFLLGAQFPIANVLERRVERARVVATIVGQAGHHAGAVVERRNQVAAAHLDGIDLQLVGESIDHSLQHERGFRPPGPAV